MVKTCTTCNIEKSIEDFHNDKYQRDGKTTKCKPCRTIAAKKWNSNNKEHIAALDKVRYDNNKEKFAAQKRQWRENNLERSQETYKKWQQNNKDKVAAHSAKRRAAKLERTPKWLTGEQIKQIEDIYFECEFMTVVSGVPHNVDHIIPMQGKNVSGLHIPENLQVITAEENNRKWCKYE